MTDDQYQLIIYTNMARILRDLHRVVFRTRQDRHLSRRVAAAQIGVSVTTLTRLELGYGGVTAESAAGILEWLGRG